MTDPSLDPGEAAARYLADGDGEGLPPHQRVRLDRVRQLLATEAMWTSPPPELADVIVADIARSSLTPSPGRRRSRGNRSPYPGPIASRVGRDRPWGRRSALAGLAAAAVVLVVALVLAGRDPTGDGDNRAREVALAGTDLAPDARATAGVRETPTGVAITLRVDGLGPAPDGFYYQAWVAGPAGLVAVGTFHLREGDDEPVELWSGVDLAAYPTLTVTLEPEDGNPASSGQRVLAGEITAPEAGHTP